jgi:hypothetical protein
VQAGVLEPDFPWRRRELRLQRRKNLPLEHDTDRVLLCNADLGVPPLPCWLAARPGTARRVSPVDSQERAERGEAERGRTARRSQGRLAARPRFRAARSAARRGGQGCSSASGAGGSFSKAPAHPETGRFLAGECRSSPPATAVAWHCWISCQS